MTQTPDPVGLHGVYPALITPLDDAGGVDREAVHALVHHLTEAGVHGLHPCGTTGEAMLLTADARMAMVDAVVEANERNLPVIVQVGDLRPETARDLARHAVDAGATAVSIVTPYYYSLDDDALFDAFAAVLDAVPGDVPAYLYNIPQNAVNRVSPELLRRAMQAYPNVLGLKSSEPSVASLLAYLELDDPAPHVWGGSDGLALANLASGAVGLVSGNANVAPELVTSLYERTVVGDMDMARRLQARLREVSRLLGDGRDLAAFKAGAAARGVPVRPTVRAPLPALAEQRKEDVRRAVELARRPLPDARC